MRVADMYLDYFNNFLSVERFADHYGKTLEEANEIIHAGRILHEERARVARLEKAAPELLEALMRARSIMVGLYESKGQAPAPVIQSFDALIAKARGES